jgi:hypothetical protein
MAFKSTAWQLRNIQTDFRHSGAWGGSRANNFEVFKNKSLLLAGSGDKIGSTLKPSAPLLTRVIVRTAFIVMWAHLILGCIFFPNIFLAIVNTD